jgi:hypothetical protein
MTQGPVLCRHGVAKSQQRNPAAIRNSAQRIPPFPGESMCAGSQGGLADRHPLRALPRTCVSAASQDRSRAAEGARICGNRFWLAHVQVGNTTRGVGSHHHRATDRQLPTLFSFRGRSPLRLRKLHSGTRRLEASATTCHERATRGWLAGTSSSVKEMTNIGVGATRPQRFSSQCARMKRTSGCRVRSRSRLVRPL